MGGVGVHIVITHDRDIAVADYRADGVSALIASAAIAEELRVLLQFGSRIRGILVEPFLAVGEAIGSERRIGFDLVVEINIGLDRLGLDGRIGLGVGGKCGLECEQAEEQSEAQICAKHGRD
jgi:hypothetical protein